MIGAPLREIELPALWHSVAIGSVRIGLAEWNDAIVAPGAPEFPFTFARLNRIAVRSSSRQHFGSITKEDGLLILQCLAAQVLGSVLGVVTDPPQPLIGPGGKC